MNVYIHINVPETSHITILAFFSEINAATLLSINAPLKNERDIHVFLNFLTWAAGVGIEIL